jgi:hypothetical protein
MSALGRGRGGRGRCSEGGEGEQIASGAKHIFLWAVGCGLWAVRILRLCLRLSLELQVAVVEPGQNRSEAIENGLQ